MAGRFRPLEYAAAMASTGRQKVILLASVGALTLSLISIGTTLLGHTRTSLSALASPSRSVRLSDGLSCEVYAPEHLDPSHNHPLVVGFSPSGNGRELLPVWKDACDRFQWILFASNNYRNGPQSDRDAALRLETVEVAKREYPVDETRIYAAGQSGGGMMAEDIIADHPDIFRGVVVNTGMMPHHWPGNAPLDRAHFPRGKVAVLLASPSDFRYREMGEDRAILEGFGWDVRWLEFPGGHAYAPPELYVEAAAWLTQR